jgi:hypothetical protein
MPRAPGGDWYAVKVDVPRTGRTEILYVQADSRQDAANIDPGSTVLGGPYLTEADAEHAAPQGSSGSTKVATGVTPAVNDLPENPLSFLGEIGHWIGVFVTDITDVYMWISLGWIALGLLLLVLGVVWLLRKTGIIPNTVPVPVPV